MYISKFPITEGAFSLDFNTILHTDEIDDENNPTILSWDDSVFSMAIQKDGKIVLAGQSDLEAVIVRLDANGNLDSTFGYDGSVRVLEGLSYTRANSVVIDCHGKIVVGHNYGFSVLRLNTDGYLDNSFGVSGHAITGFSLGPESVSSIALQRDGNIVAAGSAQLYGDTFYNFALRRFESRGCMQSMVPITNYLLD